MKNTYEVELQSRQTKIITIEAENRDEALDIAGRTELGMDVVTVATKNEAGSCIWTFFGRCESCQCPLWDDTLIEEDEDGIKVCQECAAA